MNGNPTRGPADPDDEGLDPELARLFASTTGQPLRSDTFVASVLERMRATRRRRLLHQGISVAVMLAVGAGVAPYAAEQTLRAAEWFAETLPANATVLALASPLGWLCAAIVTWRIMRQRFQ